MVEFLFRCSSYCSCNCQCRIILNNFQPLVVVTEVGFRENFWSLYSNPILLVILLLIFKCSRKSSFELRRVLSCCLKLNWTTWTVWSSWSERAQAQDPEVFLKNLRGKNGKFKYSELLTLHLTFICLIII